MLDSSGRSAPGLMALLRRERAAVLLSARVQRLGWVSRTGRFYVWGVAISSGALLTWAVSAGAAEEVPAILHAALVPMSWAAGLVAVASARELAPDEATTGMAGLAALAGLDVPSIRRARVLATMWLVIRALALPALLLFGFARFECRNVPERPPLLAGVAGALVYAAVLGMGLGGLARWCAGLSRKQGRLVFLALVLAPYVAGYFGDEVPSVVSGLGWLLHRLVPEGGAS